MIDSCFDKNHIKFESISDLEVFSVADKALDLFDDETITEDDFKIDISAFGAYEPMAMCGFLGDDEDVYEDEILYDADHNGLAEDISDDIATDDDDIDIDPETGDNQ